MANAAYHLAESRSVGGLAAHLSALREPRGPEKKTSAHQRQFIISRQTSSETSCRPSRVQRFGQPQFVLRELWVMAAECHPGARWCFFFFSTPFHYTSGAAAVTPCAQPERQKAELLLRAHNAIKKRRVAHKSARRRLHWSITHWHAHADRNNKSAFQYLEIMGWSEWEAVCITRYFMWHVS